MNRTTLAVAALAFVAGLLSALIIIGAAMQSGASEQSVLKGWQEIIGAAITGFIAALAIWFTTRETRNALSKQLLDRKDARREQIARNLAILHAILIMEKKELVLLPRWIADALKCEGEKEKQIRLSVIGGDYTFPNRTIFMNCIVELGDSNPNLTRALMDFGRQAREAASVLAEIPQRLAEEVRNPIHGEGFAAEQSDILLKRIKLAQYQAEFTQILIERWHKANATEYLLTSQESPFTAKELERLAPFSM